MEFRPRHLVGAWVALLALTAVAALLGSRHLAGWGPALSLLVAAAKALIVIGVFMRLSAGPSSPRLILATAVAMLALLVSFVVFEVRTRTSPGIVPPDVRPMSPAPEPEGERADERPQAVGSGRAESRSPRMSSR